MWHIWRDEKYIYILGFWWRKLKGKELLGRPRHRLDDIEMDLKETGWEDIE
jgi:hypothetical protein